MTTLDLSLKLVIKKTLSGNISSPTEKPYIRLWPQLIPKLASQGLSVEVNEGEDLELSVIVEAYPQITEHRWHTPTSPSTSMQEHMFVQYNNRQELALANTRTPHLNKA